jgi:hypothetical protein
MANWARRVAAAALGLGTATTALVVTPASAASTGTIHVKIVNGKGTLIHIDDGHQVCPMDPATPSKVNSSHTVTPVGNCGTVKSGIALLTSVQPGHWQLRIYRGIGKGPCFNRDAKPSPCTLVGVTAGQTTYRRFNPWARTARIVYINSTPTKLKLVLSNNHPLGTLVISAGAKRVFTYTTHDPAEDFGGDAFNIYEVDHPGCGYGDEGGYFQPRHTYSFKIVSSGGAGACTDENGGKGYNISPQITETA